MRRSVTFAAAVLAVVAGATACSEPGRPDEPLAAATSINGIGDPADTASPADTAPPTPTAPEVPLTPTASKPPSPTDTGAAALAACLDGNWTAPVAREFAALGLSGRTRGAVQGGSGVLQLTFGRDQTFTFTYADVRLDLAAGTAQVTGPVSGTWSLAGNTLRTVLEQSSTKVTFSLGPITIGAPDAVAGVVQNLPPGEVRVTCGAADLRMVLPATEGGGTVTFDRV